MNTNQAIEFLMNRLGNEADHVRDLVDQYEAELADEKRTGVINASSTTRLEIQNSFKAMKRIEATIQRLETS